MATRWSREEVSALVQAWRDALEAPTCRGGCIQRHMCERFTERCGGHTKRTRLSMRKKKEMLKNMVALVRRYNAGHQPCRERGAAPGDAAAGSKPEWFSLSAQEKKDWVKSHNMCSYGYADVDYETFHQVEQLIEMTAEAEAAKRRCYRQVSLQESAHGEWQAVREEPLSPCASAHAAIGAQPVSDDSSVTTEGEPADSPVPVKATRVTPAATRAAAVTVDSALNDDRDGSSTESDSDIGQWEADEDDAEPDSSSSSTRVESTSDQEAAKSVAGRAPGIDRSDTVLCANAVSVVLRKESPQITTGSEKHEDSLESPLVDSGTLASEKISSSFDGDEDSNVEIDYVSIYQKKQTADPELLTIINILEMQAQHLKKMLNQAREERTREQEARKEDRLEMKRLQQAMTGIAAQVKGDKEERQRDREERKRDEKERSKMLEQMDIDQAERRKDQGERTQLIKRMMVDQAQRKSEADERRKERGERRKVLLDMQKYENQSRRSQTGGTQASVANEKSPISGQRKSDVQQKRQVEDARTETGKKTNGATVKDAHSVLDEGNAELAEKKSSHDDRKQTRKAPAKMNLRSAAREERDANETQKIPGLEAEERVRKRRKMEVLDEVPSVSRTNQPKQRERTEHLTQAQEAQPAERGRSAATTLSCRTRASRARLRESSRKQ